MVDFVAVRYFIVAGILLFYQRGLLAGKDSRVEALP
jgi:hypothetical protein